jgi:hypothetical protein
MCVRWTSNRVLSVGVLGPNRRFVVEKRKSAAHKIPCRNRFMDLWPCTSLEIDMLELSKDAAGRFRPLNDIRKCNFRIRRIDGNDALDVLTSNLCARVTDLTPFFLALAGTLSGGSGGGNGGSGGGSGSKREEDKERERDRDRDREKSPAKETPRVPAVPLPPLKPPIQELINCLPKMTSMPPNAPSIDEVVRMLNQIIVPPRSDPQPPPHLNHR